MIRKPRTATHWALLTCTLGVTSGAWAALSDKAPEGVKLANTAWRLNPRQSDDPDTAIERARKEERERETQDRTGRDVLDDRNTDPNTDGTWSGGSRGGASERSSFPHGSTSTDVDPLGRGTSMSIQLGSAPSNPFLNQLARNPDRLTFDQDSESLTISADSIDFTSCAPGSKAAITDAYGAGEQSCGWDGRAWVVETTRGKSFTRKDRYELSKDGKTLRYVTTATGKNMPRVRIARTYTMAPNSG